jgi:hypothetical protein
MPTFQSRLLLLLVVLLALHPFGEAQIREFETGLSEPVKAQHLTAELISDSGNNRAWRKEPSRFGVDT